MQELQVMLKCGQPLSIRNTSEMKEILPEFRRFLDEVRLSADSKTEKMFVFSAPYLVVRLTEVVYATVVFMDKEQAASQEEVKKRGVKKTAGTKMMN